MLKTYSFPEFDYVPSPELATGEVRSYPLVIIGAGPIGLTAALEAHARGIPAVVIDDNNCVSVGSRAICFAKRPLEIYNRLSVAQRMLDKGVDWQVGKVFFRDDLVYTFDLLPESGHSMPAMINLQQYYVEEYLVDECNRHDDIDIRWKHKLVAIEQQDDHSVLTVDTPDGQFKLKADWTIACDGANSDTREMLGGTFTGKFFQDRFLIADVIMKADFPTERWFWFDPPFHRGQSVLLHKQSDNVWRIDFQLGWDADPELEKQPERVIPRIKAMLGDDVEFEIEWMSVYQFACRRINEFRNKRVIFAGDSAHQVSPFGARGANTGIQDADNLLWKLKLVMDGVAPESLMDTYHEERAFAADDNLLNSTRSTDFITPKNNGSRVLRDAVLQLSEDQPFARRLVNSGRLSTPTPYVDSSLNTPDEHAFQGLMKPGTNCADAPIMIAGKPGWLLDQIGKGFMLLIFGTEQTVHAVSTGTVTATPLIVGSDIDDSEGLLSRRYDGEPGTVYLIRPDQYIAARWRNFDPHKIDAALQRATGH